VLVLVGCNPVVVIHLAGGAHLDAVAAALVVAALVADLRGRDRPATRNAAAAAATCLACLAVTVKATAGLALAWLVVVHLRRALARPPDPGSGWMRHRAAAASVVGVDLVVVAATAALSMLLSGFGPTWIGSLSTSSEVVTGVAPASIVATVIGFPLGAVGVADADLLSVCRALALAAAAGFVCWLLWHAWRDWSRDAEAGAGLAVVGYGGLAVALGSPVVYPWYLALAVPAVAVLLADRLGAGSRVGSRQTGESRQTGQLLIVIASVWLCIATMAPLSQTWLLLGRDKVALTLAVVVVAATAAAAGYAAAATRRQPSATVER
jgi:hypothetical protein